MKIKIIDHPLVQHKLAILRFKDTGPKDFRELVNEISTLMVYEATRDIPLEEIDIHTPLQKTHAKAILGKKLGVIPILRAGLGMVEGVLHLIPAAKVGHIGIYRDHDTLKPVDYYCKLPEDLADRILIVLDPMLATGGSAAAAVTFLKEKGAKSENIKFVCIVASPEGIKTLEKADGDIELYTASIDEKLNSRGYILPGLGDAGDRLYGTI